MNARIPVFRVYCSTKFQQYEPATEITEKWSSGSIGSHRRIIHANLHLAGESIETSEHQPMLCALSTSQRSVSICGFLVLWGYLNLSKCGTGMMRIL